MRTIGTATYAVLLLLLPAGLAAQEAEVTANVGWSSEYFYRGIPQKTSSASAGLDLGISGAYLGTWAADVGDGAEVDLYGGYVLEAGDFSLGAGGTGYFYTGEFDDTYLEANFTAGYGPLGVEFSIGRYDTEPESQDYWFLGLTGEHEGGYATVGTFGSEFDGEYAEAGYGFTAADLDISVAWIYSTEDLIGDDDHNLILSVGKTFDLR